MISPRRRVLRPPATPAAADPREQARTERRRAQLAKNRIALKRRLTRLKRATNTVAKLYARISRR
jgi:hypothetical protein